MTDPIDTDKLRSIFTCDRLDSPAVREADYVIRSLCEEVDRLREVNVQGAVRRVAENYVAHHSLEAGRAIDRAEKAEATIARVREALAGYTDTCGREKHGHCLRLEDIAEVLNGDTTDG